jgi:tetratricopeptide (TPR) repeat protein
VILPLAAPPAIVAQATDRATLLRRIQAHDPDAPADLFYLDVKEKRYAEAVIYGRRYLAAHPKADAFAFDLAYAYFTLGRFDEARAVAAGRDAFLRAHPQSASIWLDLAYKDGDAGRYQQAIAEIDQYLRFRPDDAAAKQQRADDVAALAPPSPQPSPGATEAPPDRAELEKRTAAGDSDATSALFYLDVNEQRYDDALPYGERYLAAHPDDEAFAIDLAYAYVSAKRLEQAAEIADARAAYIREHAASTGILAALFYGFVDAKLSTDAVKYGRLYLSLKPDDDAFAMDLAYAELGLDQVDDVRALITARSTYLRAHPEFASIWLDISYKDEAAKHYGDAIADVDAYLQYHPTDASAKSQRAAFYSEMFNGPRFQSYGYSQYESRFSDGFFGVDTQYVLARGVIQPYIANHIIDDVTSGAPGTPQIYSDNAVIFDGGLRARVSPYAYFFAESGVGIGTRGQGTIPDLRYGFLFSQRWGRQAITEIDTSAAVYSRYQNNFISYFTAYHEYGWKRIRPIFGLNGGFDEKSIFGNNFVEGFEGIAVGTDALSVRLLQVEGAYLTRGLPIPANGRYSTFRALLVWGITK